MSKLNKSKRVSKSTIVRLMSYIAKYKLKFSFVLVSILLSAAAGVMGSMFLKIVIDDYIVPLLLDTNPDFSGLFRAVVIMGCIYALGILASLLYNRIMVVIAQGVLKKIRDEMFVHMQTLPIKYFDTHTHGDIMSHYTNDTDTLRQMISQSIPHMFSSVITIVAVFFAMLYTSVWLTLFVVVFIL
ncbi:MAG: ABC transporter transmembrane domain-containing protein, partial [Eubacteriales bacterium]|nr:ABC transporter transmembrane domain-containing protein [Eubacteriales bacterium]